MYMSFSFQEKTPVWAGVQFPSRWESINRLAVEAPAPSLPVNLPPCNSPIWSNSRSPPQAAGTRCAAGSAPASPWRWMTSGRPPPPPGSRSHQRSAPSLPPPRRGFYFWRRYWWPARREVKSRPEDQQNPARTEALIKLVNKSHGHISALYPSAGIQAFNQKQTKYLHPLWESEM